MSLRHGMRGALVAGLLAMPPAAAAEAEDRLTVHGLLDLVATERGPAFEANRSTRGDSPFDPFSVRVFGDARVNHKLQVFSQVVLRDASGIYVDGAYAVFTPDPARDLHVMGGKIPWALGTWAPRTYSNKNPLIAAPLLYSYHASLLWYEVVPSADVQLGAAGTGQTGVNYFGYAEGRGIPVVDDCYWDVGVTLTGSQRPFEYALGITAGTPGWGSTSQDENSGKTYLGRAGIAPAPWVRAGVSAAIGPYLLESLNALLPAGKTANDYKQKLLMADLEVLVGHVELRAEAARNFWETPYVGELEVNGGYVETKVLLPVGAFVAGRIEALRFGEIAGGTGARRPWDHDVTRFEAGVGYRISRDVVGKLVAQHTREERPAPAGDRDLDLVAAQLSIAF
jgi:hypothetical protein